jgi:hypothetical protein
MHRELADGNVATSFPGREDLMQNPQAPTENSVEDEEDQLIEDNDEDEEEVLDMPESEAKAILRDFFIDTYRPRCGKVLATMFCQYGPSLEESQVLT